MFFVQSQYYDEGFMACHRGFSRLGYLCSNGLYTVSNIQNALGVSAASNAFTLAK